MQDFIGNLYKLALSEERRVYDVEDDEDEIGSIDTFKHIQYAMMEDFAEAAAWALRERDKIGSREDVETITIELLELVGHDLHLGNVKSEQEAKE